MKKLEENPDQMMHIDDFEFKMMTKEIGASDSELSVQSSGGEEVEMRMFQQKTGLTNQEMDNITELSPERLQEALQKMQEGMDENAEDPMEVLNDEMRELVDISTIEDKLRNLNEEELEDLKQNRESSRSMEKIMSSMLSAEDQKLASKMMKDKEFIKTARNLKMPIDELIKKPPPFRPIQQSQEMKQLTKFLKVPRQRTKLPPPLPEDEGKITVFCELDQVLCYSFLPDETMGSMTNPAVREADDTLFIEEFKQIVYLYKNDGLEEFLNLLKEHFEPILFTSGHLVFAERVLEALNAKEVFRHVLHQDNCSLLQKEDEDIYEYVKQIDKYLGEERSASRAVLIDPSPFNSIFNPDNVIFTQAFNADTYDEFTSLQVVSQHLAQIYAHVAQGGDVREYIEEEFNVRKTLEKSKLL